MQLSRPLIRYLPIAAGTLMILFVLALTGRPGVFADTDDYLVNGRNTVMTVAYALHLKTAPEPSDDPDDIAQDRQDQLEQRLQFGSRTPWYGVPLYALQKLGTLWLVAAAQAAIAAWLIWLMWRTLAPASPRWTAYAAQGAGALGSTLPFFAGFALPDVFAGFTALCVALLLGGLETLAPLEIAGLTALLAYCATVHSSHALLIAGLLVGGSAVAWLLGRPRTALLRGAGCVAGALVVGAALGVLSMAALKWTTGDTPGRPPFLSVRLLADGPGRAYLQHACGHGQDYALCKFKDLPLDDTEEILWSDNAKLGVYETSDYPMRLRLVREDLRFAVGTLLYDPVRVAAAALRNWGAQIVRVTAVEPLRDPYFYLTNGYWKDTNLPTLVYAMGGPCGVDHHGCKPRFGPAASRWLDGMAFVLALGAIGWRLFQRDIVPLPPPPTGGVRGGGPRRLWTWSNLAGVAGHFSRVAVAEASRPPTLDPSRWRRGEGNVSRTATILVIVLGALALNALICGAISGPFDRYQARISWIAVVAAAAAMAGMVGRRREPTAPPSP